MDVLAGVKVIEVATWGFCPAAGAILAQWGADVVKIEAPQAPDPLRLMGGGTDQMSALFRSYNRGKRALAVDLSKPDGQDIAHRLAATADVFLTNMAPATRSRLKIDVADLRRANPRIVYAKGSAYGASGPDGERGGFDVAAWWCRSGLADTAMSAADTQTPPAMIGHGAVMAGMALAGGICAALVKRGRGEAAPVVESSLLGAALWFNDLHIGRELNGERATPKAPSAPLNAGMHFYETSDARFLKLHFMTDDDAHWANLFALIERHDLAQDARFASATTRTAHAAMLVDQLRSAFAAETLTYWRKRLAAATGDWTPVATAAEAARDPQTLTNGFVQNVSYEDGPFALVAPPVQFDAAPGRAARAPPFGQHTDEILRALGFERDAIAALRARGAIA